MRVKRAAAKVMSKQTNIDLLPRIPYPQITMLEPLDSERLHTLLCDADNSDCLDIRAAKRFFAKGDVIEGLYDLLRAFRVWKPHLYHDHKHREKWHIQFAVRYSVPHRAYLLTSIAGSPLRHPLPPSQRQQRRDL